MDLDSWLPRAAALRPDHPALIGADGDRLTYAGLHLRARRAAAVLRARGVGPGDRVALRLAPGPGFVAAVHAALGLGAAIVPIDLRLSAEEQAVRAAGARTVVEEPLDDEAAALRGTSEHVLRDRLDPDAVATVLHTSGTTSAPKPVELTVSNWLWNALGSALALGLDPADRWLCTLPLSHVGGLSILLRSAVYGTTVVLHERFEAERAAAALADPQLGVTLVSLVATTLQRVLDAGLSHPRRCAAR